MNPIQLIEQAEALNAHADELLANVNQREADLLDQMQATLNQLHVHHESVKAFQVRLEALKI